MMNIRGFGAAPGIGQGKIVIKNSNEINITRMKVENASEELQRLDEARKNCIDKTQQLYEYTLKEVGAEEAEIFNAHIMILNDDEFFDNVKEQIRLYNMNSEFAVAEERDRLVGVFANMKTQYLQERAADIKDISNSLIWQLMGVDDSFQTDNFTENIILTAKDLTPSDTIKINKKFLAGIISEAGGAASHTVIVRELGGFGKLRLDNQKSWRRNRAFQN